MDFLSSNARAFPSGIGLACASAALLAACATYQAQPIEPASLARSFEARRLDDPGLESLLEAATDTPASRSWDLTTLTIAGMYFDPGLEVARKKWRASRAAVITAARHPNPSLDASAGRATNTPAGEPHGLFDLGLQIPIETAGKREHRVAAAGKLSESARLDVRTAAWKVRAAIRDSLLEWNAARIRSAILAREVDARKSIAGMVARRVALGAASSTQEAVERSALSRARFERAASQAQAMQARARLAAAIGIPQAALDGVVVRFPGLHAVDVNLDRAQLRKDALFHRSDVRAALARHAAAESLLQLEIAKQYPDVALGPSYSYDTGTNKFSLGVVSLTLPLLDRNEGPIAEAGARRDEAASEFEALQDRVLGALELAIANVRGARRALSFADSAVAAEHVRSRKIERRFEAGEEDRLARATSQASLFSAELSRSQAVLNAAQAIAGLEDATQTPLFDSGLDGIDSRIVEGARP